MRAIVAIAILGACGPAGGGGDDGGNDDDGDDGGLPDGGMVGCSDAPRCSAWNVASHCGVETTCPVGCYAGACVADGCADECAIGDSGPSKTCRLWDVAAGEFVDADPGDRMIDRARDYDARQRRDYLPEGGVASAIYTTPSLTAVASYDGVVDSALWTGTLLASHGWRHLVTGAPDAAARIAAMTRTLHVWFNVSTSPGYLARYAVPEGSSVPIEMDCARDVIHCDASFEGVTYRWRGDTSRDQYTGVMLGYLFAYLGSSDPAVRATIRHDVVELVEQLMIERQDVPVRATVDGFPIETTLDSKYIVLAPEEMIDGRVAMEIDTGDLGGGELDGAREFVPDLGPLLGQIIGVAPAIPRPGSAMMLGAFYRIALLVTDGEPDYAARRDAIRTDYDAAFEVLAELAAQWTYDNACGAKYYGTHIAYVMGYAWTLLEDEPARRARLRTEVMGALADDLGDHANAYYAFFDAGATGVATANAAAMALQLADFPRGPRVYIAQDHAGEYPHDPDCSDAGLPMSSVAVDVGDRIVTDFLWQRHPWRLVAGGAPSHVAPGVDYLAAYWLGRYHGAIADDRPRTCTRWD
jgi:hypothetical protein